MGTNFCKLVNIADRDIQTNHAKQAGRKLCFTKFYANENVPAITNCSIKRVKDAVVLGVILDENLAWNKHIANVARKISKSIGIIHKSSFFLPLASLQTLYFSLIYPYLVYCVSVWASTYPLKESH